MNTKVKKIITTKLRKNKLFSEKVLQDKGNDIDKFSISDVTFNRLVDEVLSSKLLETVAKVTVISEECINIDNDKIPLNILDVSSMLLNVTETLESRIVEYIIKTCGEPIKVDSLQVPKNIIDADSSHKISHLLNHRATRITKLPSELKDKILLVPSNKTFQYKLVYKESTVLGYDSSVGEDIIIIDSNNKTPINIGLLSLASHRGNLKKYELLPFDYITTLGILVDPELVSVYNPRNSL